MWLLERDALRRGLDATTRLGPLLTDDRRAVVLAIKEAAVANDRRVSGLAVCQAVVYDDVGSLEEFDRWRLRREARDRDASRCRPGLSPAGPAMSS
jgi:hypothetical protein